MSVGLLDRCIINHRQTTAHDGFCISHPFGSGVKNYKQMLFTTKNACSTMQKSWSKDKIHLYGTWKNNLWMFILLLGGFAFCLLNSMWQTESDARLCCVMCWTRQHREKFSCSLALRHRHFVYLCILGHMWILFVQRMLIWGVCKKCFKLKDGKKHEKSFSEVRMDPSPSAQTPRDNCGSCNPLLAWQINLEWH